ncbi:unnamed protein product, partial [Brenthis ino]
MYNNCVATVSSPVRGPRREDGQKFSDIINLSNQKVEGISQWATKDLKGEERLFAFVTQCVLLYGKLSA